MQIIKSNFIIDFCVTASRITNTVRYTALIVYLRILALCIVYWRKEDTLQNIFW